MNKRRTVTIRREYDPGPYRTLDEIREANRTTGHHWFSDDTMRSFGTRLGGEHVYAGRFFVSSDHTGFDRRGRAYTVRVAMPDGSIDDVGGFLAFSTNAQAHRVAESMAAATFEVQRDPYEGTEDREPNPKNYEWRVWATTPRGASWAIGTRNTKRAAEQLARTLRREQKARR